MAHTHVVADSDAYFTIDPMTRAIKKEESSKTSLIVGDHNSERFSFELPRYIEGHDMSLCNVVRVHYMNTSSSKSELQSVGVYEVDDFGILATDDTKMGLSWLISNNATKHVGKLAFTVQFACMTGYRVNYSWQSGVYSSISISDGINGSEIVFDEYADILQQWWLKLYASSELPIKVLTSEELAALDGNTEPEVLYILEDDPSVSMLENHNTTLIEHAKRITTTETDIKNHDVKFKNLDTELAEHTERINDAESTMASHASSILDHDERLGNAETAIRSANSNLDAYGEQLGNVETLIEDHGDRLGNAETYIEGHKKEFTELKDGAEPFYKHHDYTVITDVTSEIVNSIQSGLWLFKVVCGGGDPVSVIMDTACEYSSTFTVSWVGDGTTNRFYAALKRANMDYENGLVTIRLVRYLLPTTEGGVIKEMYPDNEIIYGKPFGFSNPVG